MAGAKTKQQLTAENEELRARLQELEDTLEAIRSGAVDAIVMTGPVGERVYTLEGADRAYRTMVESMSEGAVTMMTDGTILYANGQFAAMTGSSPEEIAGRCIHDFVSPSDLFALEDLIRGAGFSAIKSEIRLIRPPAIEVPVLVSASPIDLQGTEARTLVVMDLSESKRLEDIVAAEKLSRSILEQAREAIAVCIDGHIVRANRALSDICGSIPLMQSFDQIFSFQMPESQTFSVAIPESGKTIRNQAVRYQRPDGTPFELLLSAGPLFGSRGEVLGCLISLTDVTGLKQAEHEIGNLNRELQRKIQNLEAIFETAPIGLAITEDPEGLRIRGNPAIERTLGLPRGAELSKSSRESARYRILQDGRELAIDDLPLQRAVRGDHVSSLVVDLVREDGRAIKLFSTASPLLDEQSRPRGAVGAFLDITELARAQEALRESEERYRVLLDTAPDAIVVHRDGQILFANKAALRLYGAADFGQLQSRNIVDLLHPDDRDLTRERIRRVQSGETTELREARLLRLDGRELPVEATAGPVDYEGLRAVQVILRDVTQRRQTQQALRESGARFRLLSETAAQLLASDNPQGLIESLCRKVMEHLNCQAFFNFMVDERADRLRLNACAGIPEEEVRKLEWLDYGVAVCGCVARDGVRIIAEDIFHTPDVRTELVRSYGIQAYCCHPLKIQDRLVGTLSFGTKTRARFTPDEVELMRTVADQVAVALERVLVQKELRRSRDELEVKVRERTAELIYMMGEIERSRDDLRRLASELVMAEEQERKRIAVTLHDEVAQTLAAAKMRLDMLKSLDTASDYDRVVREIRDLLAQSIRETRSLMTDISSPVLYDMGLASAVQTVADQVSADSGIVASYLFRGDLSDLHMEHAVMIYHVVKELLHNVVKHSGARSASIRIAREDNIVRTVVADDGRGFEATGIGAPGRGDEGGFGLFSIRERVKSFDGDLQIESAPGKGTVITVTLPVPGEQKETRPEAGAPHQGSKKRKP